jgi:hypothetical protein
MHLVFILCVHLTCIFGLMIYVFLGEVRQVRRRPEHFHYICEVVTYKICEGVQRVKELVSYLAKNIHST